jgi:glycine/D-amino acid oxidase-like deaminating enzyme
MSARYDAIIIGAGIIGACTAFELAKRGWRTLNVDRLPAAGYGSTGSSCAIIRTHYSTLDGAALGGRDHDRDPLQFRLERAAHTVSIGFFSRLREVNRESSFSVLG